MNGSDRRRSGLFIATRLALVVTLAVMAGLAGHMFSLFQSSPAGRYVPSFEVFAGLLLLTGLWLIRLGGRHDAGALRAALCITGAAAAGIPLSILAHGLGSAALSEVFGRPVEEPVFFVLAVLVLPVVALAGALVSLWRSRG